jgi:hypothetical protein
MSVERDRGQLLERARILREQLATLDAGGRLKQARHDRAAFAAAAQEEQRLIQEFVAVIDEVAQLRKRLIDRKAPEA